MNPGHPRMLALVRDSWANVRARPGSSAATAAVIALICLVTLATTGRTAATENQVISTVDSLGTRMITVIDNNGEAGIDASVVEILAGVEGVEWVFALGPADDATLPGMASARTGVPVSARTYMGELPVEVGQVLGRPARPGEAVAGVEAANQLGLDLGAGTASTKSAQIPVVGTFEATGPLAALNGMVLVNDTSGARRTVRYVYVRSAASYDVQGVAELIQALVPAQQPNQVEVEVADGALQLRSVLSGTLGQSSRQLMATVLGVGLVLVWITLTGAVNSRRRDFGRQRALGASRSAIVTMVLAQAAIAGAIGVVLGTAGGLAATWAIAGALPRTAFILGLMGLSLLVTILGAMGPAIVASRRDPVRILRVP